jgi:DNA-binding response OmpR family regulator
MPIIVLTGRCAERDVVRALHLGADDYLVKPPRLSELLARIDVVTRHRRARPESPAAPTQVHAQGITVDLAARTVCRDGNDVPLTRTEFAVLAVLCERPGEAVSREQILDRVWGDTFVSTSRSLSVHLTQLRAKLQRPGLVTTIRGHGYRFG